MYPGLEWAEQSQIARQVLDFISSETRETDIMAAFAAGPSRRG
jgi:hypothetical protein